MKLIAWLVAATILAVAGSTRAQEDQKSEPKMAFDVLDLAFGIKTKSVVVKEPKAAPKTRIQLNEDKTGDKTKITITFSFTRTAKDEKEFLAVQEALVASPGVAYRFETMPLIFHLFDDENVCIEKITISAIEGDLTCKTGDVFRAVLNCPTDTFHKAKRIEARYYRPLQ